MSGEESRDPRAKETGQGKKKRRVFSAEKKYQIFLEAQRGEKPVGEILRREGIYSSDLVRIQKQVREGALERLSVRPGAKSKTVPAEAYEALRRELEEKERALAEQAVELSVLRKKNNGDTCALGHNACLLGFKALYFRAPRLFEDLSLARGDGRYLKLMNTMAKADLVVLDDWGLSSLTDQEKRDFLEIQEDRHGIRSTVLATQIPTEHWHELMKNPTLADAILDRLIHNAYQINLKGESIRKTKSRQNQDKIKM